MWIGLTHSVRACQLLHGVSRRVYAERMNRTSTATRTITDYRAAVAAEVRAELARQQVHQSTVARALGLSEMAVSRRTTGKTSFSVEELATVAAVLGVDVRDLLPVGSAVVRVRTGTGSYPSETAERTRNGSRRAPGSVPRERDIPAPGGHWPRHYVYGLHQRAESFQLAHVA